MAQINMLGTQVLKLTDTQQATRLQEVTLQVQAVMNWIGTRSAVASNAAETAARVGQITRLQQLLNEGDSLLRSMPRDAGRASWLGLRQQALNFLRTLGTVGGVVPTMPYPTRTYPTHTNVMQERMPASFQSLLAQIGSLRDSLSGMMLNLTRYKPEQIKVAIDRLRAEMAKAEVLVVSAIASGQITEAAWTAFKQITELTLQQAQTLVTPIEQVVETVPVPVEEAVAVASEPSGLSWGVVAGIVGVSLGLGWLLFGRQSKRGE